MNQSIKVVILCGGQGTRLREETEHRPKPLVDIGSKPMLWHIMKIYAHFGFNNFVLCLGYKGQMIKEYFLHYAIMTQDITLQMAKPNQIQLHDRPNDAIDWCITMAETGQNAQTGARVKRIQKYIDSDIFLLTYGDGVADVPIDKLISFHCSHGKIATVTAVRPQGRFGEIVINSGQVCEFNEKPQVTSGAINGGFFVFNRKFFDYLNDDENLILEQEPLQHLANNGELMAFEHNGFWQPMDTYREYKLLNDLWALDKPPWKLWNP